MKRYSWLLLILFSYTSCDNLVKSKDSSTETRKKKPLKEGEEDRASDDEAHEDETSTRKKRTDDQLVTQSDAEVMNNIVIQESGGLKVSQAYLSFEDGRLVPKSNRVALGEDVNLVITIEDGWEVQDGQVSIDANEMILTNEGQVVLNATNLFKTMPRIDADDARQINLKATITKTSPKIDHFVVNFRVWDKRGEGEIKGSYKLYVDEE